jgi:hypothetical protein
VTIGHTARGSRIRVSSACEARVRSSDACANQIQTKSDDVVAGAVDLIRFVPETPLTEKAAP